MKIEIEIDCETVSEFYSHLTELRYQIKKESKRLKLKPLVDEFSEESNSYLSDNNCYGTHTVTITPELEVNT